MNFLIYKHTSPSGKSYIGQTKSYQKRNKEHRLGCGCTAFSKAIRKYGWDSFTHQILAEGLSVEDANQKEIELIQQHGTLVPNGYNLRTGGENGLQSLETRARMSAAQTGKKASAEAKKKMSIAKIGRPLSPDHVKKLSDVRQGHLTSPETRTKISNSLTGHNVSELTKARISLAKRNPSMQTRIKLSESKRGIKQSTETKEKRSRSLKGFKHTDETKAAMSAAAKLRELKKKEAAKQQPLVVTECYLTDQADFAVPE